ncbi:MAG: YbaB/EbfC family nucleoid-associated protein [Rickettsiales bacterium]|nr:MAG: YbaB/EbfC family nucleoid-associated protein [Rickettsiales bacterium]
MDINQLMKQAQEMQKQMQSMQEDMAAQEFEGKSGGGLVTITMTGNGEMKGVSIDPTLLKTDEKEILEDLIVAAFNEAKTKADEKSKDSMSGAFGDLGNLPSGLKF